MLLIVSPAKSLDYESATPKIKATQPRFLPHSEKLIALLRTLSADDIAERMQISEALATLNVTRYAAWQLPFTSKNARPAVFAFNGDVYDGLQAKTLEAPQLAWLQSHLRILSGLYGVLRPFDLMQAYRLEMGSRLANAAGKNLYAFWGELLAESLRAELKRSGEPVLVNLASDEYFSALRFTKNPPPIITPVFEDWKNDRYKVISFFAKRARGLMARWAALHEVEEVEALKAFAMEGYTFAPKFSTEDRWIFRRKLSA